MKETPAGVAQRFLLAVSILFGAASAPPRAHGQSATKLTTPAELDALSRYGPAIPATFPMDNLEFRALFKWDWSLYYAYELKRPGTVTLTVSVDGHEHPVVYSSSLVRGVTMLRANFFNHVCTIPLPGGIGAATYSIKAVTQGPPPADGPPFRILWIAAGPPPGSAEPAHYDLSPENFAWPRGGARLTDAAYSPPALRTAVPLGLAALSFTPRDIRFVGDQPSRHAAYSFRTTLPFNGGAEVRVNLEKNGNSTTVSRRNLDRKLDADENIEGTWDGTSSGSPSLGPHTLYVRAWRTIDRNGRWSAVASMDSVLVRR